MLQLYKTNLPRLEEWTKISATKMIESELWNNNKTFKTKLTNQNTQKMK